MSKCIYCRKEIENPSIEHIIPQFLGGDYAPNEFKTKDVCKKCNNDLGQFVDASFARNFFISSYLFYINFSFLNTTKPIICFGYCDLVPPHIKDDEVCEMWCGRLGEQVYWIRPKYENFSTYVGGDPQKAKKQKSRAYFIFSSKSQKNPKLSLATFENAFKKQKKTIKKVLCGTVEGINISDIGFSEPDDIDKDRIKYFKENCFNGKQRLLNITPINFDFEIRFLAKLSIGISYALFGEKVLNTIYGKNLNNTLWRKGKDIAINGSSNLCFNNFGDNNFGDEKKLTDELLEEKYGVLFFITKLNNTIIFRMQIGNGYLCTIQCASDENLTSEDYDKIGDGRVIILYDPIKEYINMSFIDYINHKFGRNSHLKLAEIHSKAEQCENYFKNLGNS